jgi:thiaminase (transcriptional activator TenA)
MSKYDLRKFTISIVLFIMIFSKSANANSYVEEMLCENNDLYKKILEMPFNSELANGTLDENIFKSYMIQDYIYIEYYRKAFAILLTNAPDKDAADFIVSLIMSTVDKISSVHDVYIKNFNITETELTKTSPLPSTELYISYIIKTVTMEPFEIGLVAMLPCYWVHYQLGIGMDKSKPSEKNKYATWIKANAPDQHYKDEINAYIKRLNCYMESTSTENRSKIKQAFKTAMNLEYKFWDGVYRDIQWQE